VTLLEPQREGIPLPVPTVTSQPFWDGCARHELLYQRCVSCSRPIFIPAEVCRWCGSGELEWQQSAGEGSIYSWTVAWRPQGPSFQTPYVAIIVDMDEGYQMLSNLIGCEPDDAHAGMRVTVDFHPVGGKITLPYFRPLAL
jgi:uncharacterized protein